MEACTSIASLYSSGILAHELRLSRADDSYQCISTSEGKIENSYLTLHRSELKKTLSLLDGGWETEIKQAVLR